MYLHFGCFGLMGLWRNCNRGLMGLWCNCNRRLMVSATMAFTSRNDSHSGQRDVPIVIAAAVWGPQWRGKEVLFKCDNEAVVTAIQSGSVRDPILMHLLQCLFFMVAAGQFSYTSSHIPGSTNTTTDALSCTFMSTFWSSAPLAKLGPTKLPPFLQELPFHSQEEL